MKWTDSLVELQSRIKALPPDEQTRVIELCKSIWGVLRRNVPTNVENEESALSAARRARVGASDLAQFAELVGQLPPSIAEAVDEVMSRMNGAITRVMFRLYSSEAMMADAKNAAPELIAWVEANA